MEKILCPNCEEKLTKISIYYKSEDDTYDDYEFKKDGYYHLTYTHMTPNDKVYFCNKCGKEITDENVIEDIEDLLVY